MKKLREELSKILKETLTNEDLNPNNVDVQQSNSEPIKIRFNKGLENEYIVIFSKRGFLIGNTRLSFEEMHNAISKRYTITLEDGTILDAVKMQQILKYEDRY